MQSQNFLLESLFILISLDKWLHGVNLLYLQHLKKCSAVTYLKTLPVFETKIKSYKVIK